MQYQYLLVLQLLLRQNSNIVNAGVICNPVLMFAALIAAITNIVNVVESIHYQSFLHFRGHC